MGETTPRVARMGKQGPAMLVSGKLDATVGVAPSMITERFGFLVAFEGRQLSLSRHQLEALS